ncbi:hypothetical protein VNI00_014306 [Paramarasmius palmivorus]|uniref:Uncharacterized protein n=1 Tax=Paramarasmius palmivorus TaxID=297713 RepID=A0AAW0BUJ9_9AGAR
MDWDTFTSFRADPSFNLSDIIFARAKFNSTQPPDGVVDHPPLEPPELEGPYQADSPFASPLSPLTPDGSLSPLTPLSSAESLSPLTPLSSSESIMGLVEESQGLEETGKKKVRRRKRKKGKNVDVTTSALPSTSASPLPSATPSPLPSTSASPLPSTSASPLPSASASPLPSSSSLPSGSPNPQQHPANPETKRKHKSRQAKRRRLKDSAATMLGAKNLKVSTTLSTNFANEDMHNETEGYLGSLGRVLDDDARVYSLNELVGPDSQYKFRLQSIPSDATTIPIIDKSDTVIGLLVGPPRGDASWNDVVKTAARELEEARKEIYFEDKRLSHKRGWFPVQPFGYSFGGGQLRPKRVYHTPKNEEVLQRLTDQPCFKRLAGHANGAFATWAPKVYRHYLDYDSRIRSKHPDCTRNFENSVWACATYNFGPNTVTVQHIDHLNYIFGWCAITALGSFDYRKGGHIVLWELGLVLEFPPGWTILIPSSYIRHSNTPIADEESRYSFTQYTAGGLFRWVDDGFRLRTKMKKSQKKKAAARDKKRVQKGLSLYSTLAELRTMYEK